MEEVINGDRNSILSFIGTMVSRSEKGGGVSKRDRGETERNGKLADTTRKKIEK
jgi:hypothetical protein